MQFGDGIFFPETLGSSLPGEHGVLTALWNLPAFQVQKSSVFRRNGADIHSDLLISVAQAVLGGTARCQGLYETINITVSTSILGMNQWGTAEASPLLQRWGKSPKSASIGFQTPSGLSLG